MNEAERRDLLRAEEAKRLLEHPLLVEAFDAIEKKLLAGWRNSQASKPEEREKVYWLITAMDEFKAVLTSHITTGKLVATELEQGDYQRERGVSLTYGGTGNSEP